MSDPNVYDEVEHLSVTNFEELRAATEKDYEAVEIDIPYSIEVSESLTFNAKRVLLKGEGRLRFLRGTWIQVRGGEGKGCDLDLYSRFEVAAYLIFEVETEAMEIYLDEPIAIVFESANSTYLKTNYQPDWKGIFLFKDSDVTIYEVQIGQLTRVIALRSKISWWKNGGTHLAFESQYEDSYEELRICLDYETYLNNQYVGGNNRSCEVDRWQRLIDKWNECGGLQ
jgi:hypothetical protein